MIKFCEWREVSINMDKEKRNKYILVTILLILIINLIVISKELYNFFSVTSPAGGLGTYGFDRIKLTVFILFNVSFIILLLVKLKRKDSNIKIILFIIIILLLFFLFQFTTPSYEFFSEHSIGSYWISRTRIYYNIYGMQLYEQEDKNDLLNILNK